MIESFFAYIAKHDWALWTLMALIFGPLILKGLFKKDTGFFESIVDVVGWWAFLLLGALLLV